MREKDTIKQIETVTKALKLINIGLFHAWCIPALSYKNCLADDSVRPSDG